ncbi:MAG: hypothetical protein IPF79_02560 [Ignavibacteria bacterium]|nr:hypothetical protein [Ignavibacteria bacterium]
MIPVDLSERLNIEDTFHVIPMMENPRSLTTKILVAVTTGDSALTSI